MQTVLIFLDRTRAVVLMEQYLIQIVVIVDYLEIVSQMTTAQKKQNVLTITVSTLVRNCHLVVRALNV